MSAIRWHAFLALALASALYGAPHTGSTGPGAAIGPRLDTNRTAAARPPPPQQAAAPRSNRLRILAYNIRHGEGMDHEIDLERVARVINALEPDIVALQEVDSAVERTGGVDQTRVLGELTGMHSVFGGFFDYQGGRYGMALLSKYPFVSYRNDRLPDGREPRTALAARLRVGEPAREIVVVGIHLYATAEERLAQARRLLEIYRDETAPVILAGDFNSTPDSEVIGLFRGGWRVPDKGADHLTFPSDKPEREIDYIIYRPPGALELVSQRALDQPIVSDHRPVIMEAVLRHGN